MKTTQALVGLLIAIGGLASPAVLAQHPVDSLQPGHWFMVPNSRMSAVDPCPASNCSYSGFEGQRAVMDDWNGGAFATGFGTMGALLVFGGGHNGYFGNEVTAFDVANLRWERLSNPVQDNGCSYTEAEMNGGNGSPCSPHTYDYLEYHPGTNSFVKLGSASDHDRGGLGSPRVHLFNLDTRVWRRGARKPTFPGVGGEGGLGHTGASSAYDPTRDVFWLLPGYNGRFGMYDPNANAGAGAWTEYNRYNIDIDAVAAVDPIRDLYVVVEGRLNNELLAFDLKNPNGGGRVVNVTGDTAFLNSLANGFEWDPVGKYFVGWVSGSAVYRVIPPATTSDWRTAAWQIVRVNAAASNTVTPTSPNNNGTYSRFRYVPALNAYILVNRTTDNVYFYKATTGTVVQPTVTLSANPTSVAAQGTTQLTWSTTNADTCQGSSSPSIAAWNGTRPTSGSGVAIGPLAATTSFTLSCSNSTGGSLSRSVSVTVAGGTPAPTIGTFSANPTSVASGGASTLSWSTTNATSCNGTGGVAGWPGTKATTGSQSVSPIAAASTFMLSCTGAGGTANRNVTVSIAGAPGAPTVALSANPTSVASGARTTLTWSSTNATGCAASGGWAGTKASSGSEQSAVLTQTSTFTLDCTGTGGTAQQSVQVTVSAAATEPDSGGGAFGLHAVLALLALLAIRLRRTLAPGVALGLLGLVAAPAHAQSADWIARSTAPGVVYSTTFTQAVVDAGRFANGNDPALLANVIFSATGGTDGTGSLRINVPRSTNSDPGAWRMEFPRFWGAGDNNTRFYVQFRLRIPTGRNTGCQSGDGWKISNISSYARSLTSFEVVPWNYSNTGWLRAYYGGSPPFTPDPNPDFIMPENQWFTIYVEIQAARYGGSDANNRVVLRAARQGETTWTTIYNLTGGNWFGTDSDAPDGFDGLWFTPYNTNRASGVCADSWQEYDELIISTQPIAVPGGGGGPPPPPGPTVTFTANPTTVQTGTRSQLTWSSTNATTCTASGAWAGNKATSGTEQSPIINQNRTFNLQCTGDGGTATRSVTVTVSASPPPPPPAPTVQLAANPTTVVSGSTTTLTWSTTNATSCTASGGWTGTKATSGTQTTAALTTATTYSLQCTGAGGSANGQTSVNVTAPGTDPPPADEESGGGRFDLAVLCALLSVWLLASHRGVFRRRG